ncbi:GNAT family N-acetyltransferase [Elizabethkingia argentiflava]|uniref:GNAT family N-acetyltransferase n=1 Tax=Elizabethkingia argenteiflava TaxID=2681556 RepID=A0A845PSQ4_9FLAO|nr:GNAT family N-acetyltransferase [Elizabethkingia argenteiflava]NAW50053.1 GNAT family N-acetyltransferase [Elizabethkingia argenteiflava]
MEQQQTFSQLKESEIENILEMMYDFYSIDHYPFDEQLTRQNLYQFIKNPYWGQVFMIYNEQGIAIGYIVMAYMFSFEFGGKIAFLDELFLGEKARGKGYGKKAVDFIKKFAAAQDLKVVMLEVERHNHNALELYRGKGFQSHHRDLMIYHPQN